MTKNDIVRNIDIVIDSVLVDNYKKLSKEDFIKYFDSKILYTEEELEYHIRLDRIKNDLMLGKRELTNALIVEVSELITGLTTIQQTKYKELYEYKKWI